jgi:hypothetical protein
MKFETDDELSAHDAVASIKTTLNLNLGSQSIESEAAFAALEALALRIDRLS